MTKESGKQTKSRDPRIAEQRRTEQKATISEILIQNHVFSPTNLKYWFKKNFMLLQNFESH